MNTGVVILTDRDEVADIVGRELTDKEWLKVQVKLNSDKRIWQVVDEAIADIVEALEGE